MTVSPGLVIGTLLGVPYSLLTTNGCVCSISLLGLLAGVGAGYYADTCKDCYHNISNETNNINVVTY